MPPPGLRYGPVAELTVTQEPDIPKFNTLSGTYISKYACTEAATGGVLLRKGVLRNFAKSTGKQLCQSLFK